jgi:hypothetical protein
VDHGLACGATTSLIIMANAFQYMLLGASSGTTGLLIEACTSVTVPYCQQKRVGHDVHVTHGYDAKGLEIRRGAQEAVPASISSAINVFSTILAMMPT